MQGILAKRMGLPVTGKSLVVAETRLVTSGPANPEGQHQPEKRLIRVGTAIFGPRLCE